VAGPTPDEGNANYIVEVIDPFSSLPMTTHEVTVVGEEDHHCLVTEVLAIQRLQYSPDFPVDETRHPVGWYH